MKTQVQKWGNSLALRIPRAFAVELGLAADGEVDLSLEDGRLVLQPQPQRRYRLSDLLDRVTAENLHAESDFGPAVGGESW